MCTCACTCAHTHIHNIQTKIHLKFLQQKNLRAQSYTAHLSQGTVVPKWPLLCQEKQLVVWSPHSKGTFRAGPRTIKAQCGALTWHLHPPPQAPHSSSSCSKWDTCGTTIYVSHPEIVGGFEPIGGGVQDQTPLAVCPPRLSDTGCGNKWYIRLPSVGPNMGHIALRPILGTLVPLPHEELLQPMGLLESVPIISWCRSEETHVGL